MVMGRMSLGWRREKLGRASKNNLFGWPLTTTTKGKNGDSARVKTKQRKRKIPGRMDSI